MSQLPRAFYPIVFILIAILLTISTTRITARPSVWNSQFNTHTYPDNHSAQIHPDPSPSPSLDDSFTSLSKFDEEASEHLENENCPAGAQCVPVSILSSMGLRGSLWPVPRVPNHNCYHDNAYEDSKCDGGCVRRVAMARYLQTQHPELITTENGAGIYFGNGEVAFTLYGSRPSELCIKETRYDVISLGGSDLYMGLETARDFFTTVGRKVSPVKNSLMSHLNSLQHFVLSHSTSWSSPMQSASYLHHNGQSVVIDGDHREGTTNSTTTTTKTSKSKGKTKSEVLAAIRSAPPLNDIGLNNAHAQFQMEQYAIRPHDFVLEKEDKEKEQGKQTSPHSHSHSPKSTPPPTPPRPDTRTRPNTSNDDDLDSPTTFQPLQQPPLTITRPHIISTNLVAENDKWKLFLQPSALITIPNTAHQVLFVSILPDFYRESLTNPPSWFKISPHYSAVNHIRAELTKYKRLDVNGNIKAVVALVQEIRPKHPEIEQIEGVNVFIMPRAALQDDFYIKHSIYRDRIGMVKSEAGGNALTLTKFKVDVVTKQVYELNVQKIPLDYETVITQHKIPHPISLQTGTEMRYLLSNFNPNNEDVSKATLSELMSDVDGRDYVVESGYYGYTPSSTGCRTSTCPMGLLASKALLSVCHDSHIRTAQSKDCEIAFLNAGAIRGSFFHDEKTITLQGLLKVFPFHNKIVSFDISGAVIEKMLAHAVRSGRSGRFLQSNMKWVYFPYDSEPPKDVSIEDALNRVMDLAIPTPDGGFIPVLRNTTYKVVTLSYILEGNDGFDSVFDSTVRPENIIYHSDSLLTAIMSHCRRNRFTWEVSRDELNLCLFNQTMPLTEPSCLMAFSTKTKNDYRTCPANEQWCLQTVANQKKGLKIIEDAANGKKKRDGDGQFWMNSNSLSDKGRNFGQEDHNPKLLHSEFSSNDMLPIATPFGSTFDYFLSDDVDAIGLEETQNSSQNSQNKHFSSESSQRKSFYAQIPSTDLASLSQTPDAIPPSTGPRIYQTPSTHWAKSLIDNGDLVIVNSKYFATPNLDQTNSSNNSNNNSNNNNLFSPTQSSPDIVLINDIQYDPEMPVLSEGCGTCSGYGICRDDQQCECTVSAPPSPDSPILLPTLLNGVPTKGLYKGLRMVSGKDCSSVMVRSNQSFLVFFAIAFLGSFTLVASIAAFVVLFMFRKHPVIKSAGADMMSIMAIGAILTSCGVICGVYDPFSDKQRSFIKLLISHPDPLWSVSTSLSIRLWFSATAVCNLQFVLILLGFAVLFASILAKFYRIHRIFNAKTLHEIREFSNTRPRLLLVAAVLLQVIILSVALSISPMRPTSHSISGSGKNPQETHFWVGCGVESINKSDDMFDTESTLSRLDGKIVAYIVLALYNVALLVVGIYLSIATRNVDKRFNESTILAISVYNIAFSSIVFFITTSFSSPSSKVVQMGIVSYGIISTLGVMLWSKFKEIWKQRHNPEGESVLPTQIRSFDPILLRTQALERENNLNSTITTQQEQIATLIQHILCTDADPSKDKFLQGFEDSHHRKATIIEDNAAASVGPNSSSSSESASRSSKSTTDKTSNRSKPRFKPEVQTIIDQYGGGGLEMSSTISNSSYFPASSTSASAHSKSEVASAVSNMDESEQRRNRLKGTFKNTHLRKRAGGMSEGAHTTINTSLLSTPTDSSSSVFISPAQHVNDEPVSGGLGLGIGFGTENPYSEHQDDDQDQFSHVGTEGAREGGLLSSSHQPTQPLHGQIDDDRFGMQLVSSQSALGTANFGLGHGGGSAQKKSTYNTLSGNDFQRDLKQ